MDITLLNNSTLPNYTILDALFFNTNNTKGSQPRINSNNPNFSNLPTPKFTNKAIWVGLGITALIGAGIWIYNKIKQPDTDLDVNELARKALEGGGLSKPIEVIKTTPKDSDKPLPKDCLTEWGALATLLGIDPIASGLKKDPIELLIKFWADDMYAYKDKILPYYDIINKHLCTAAAAISRDCAIELMKRVLAEARLSHLLDDPNYDLNKMLDEC